MKRRQLLTTILALSLVSPVAADAQQSRVNRVEGVLDAKTYRGLEAFLFNSMDEVVGLDIRVEVADGAGPGSLNAGLSPEGQFVAYLVGGKDSEIVAQDGFTSSRGSVTFDGYFIVKSGGLHQGIESLFLDKTDEASVLLSKRPIKTIEIERLDPKIRKP